MIMQALVLKTKLARHMKNLMGNGFVSLSMVLFGNTLRKQMVEESLGPGEILEEMQTTHEILSVIH